MPNDTISPRPTADLHVAIVNDLTGHVEADVDATSTVDALAYFLTTRGHDPAATPGGIADACAGRDGRLPPRTATVVWESRGVLGDLLAAYGATVSASHCAYCAQVTR